ncbi:MAG: CopG family transcriptional regulator [Ahrensia sp.]|jgi:hypothetical protein|nr:CopG family transcriptional regulator [Ahrensia sp.]
MKRILSSALLASAIGLNATGTGHAQDGMTITVYKTPWCGCCHVWTEAVQKAGYTVKVHDIEDLTQVKKQAGVSAELEACHTAVLDTGRKYVLEGHVPIEAVEKLMSERPEIRGIATPGMPSGSLGMGNDPNARYDVLAFTGNAADRPTVFYEAGKR